MPNKFCTSLARLSLITLSVLLGAAAQETTVEKHPTQKELADVIGFADRMVITEPLKDVPIFELSATGIGKEFLEQFAIDEHSEGFHDMCYGDAWISFFTADQKKATISFHHARSIRWVNGPWQSDALLGGNGGVDLSKWFKKKGFEKFEELRLAAIAYEQAERKKQRNFKAQLPTHVVELIEKARGASQREHTFARRALAAAPDRARLAASVFRAFGQLPLDTLGYDSAMSICQKIIEISDGNDLARALESVETDSAGLKGAAYLFTRTPYHKLLPTELAEIWGPKLASVVFDSSTDEPKQDALRRLNSIPGKKVDDFLVAIASGKLKFSYSAHLKPNKYHDEPDLVSAACLVLAMRHHPEAAVLAEASLSTHSDIASIAALEVALRLATGKPPLRPEIFKLQSFLIGFGGIQVLKETPPDQVSAKLVGAALKAPWGAVREEAEALAYSLDVGPIKKPLEQNYRDIEYDKGLAEENPHEAISTYSEQLKIARGTTKADLLRLRGVAYSLLGRNEEALVDYRAARQLEHRRDEIPRMIATALWRLGRSDEAIEGISNEFPQSDPWNLEVRGLAYLSKGDFSKAEQDLTASVLIDPRDIGRQFLQHLAAGLSGHPEFSRLASMRKEALSEDEEEANQWIQKIGDLLSGRINGEVLLKAAQTAPAEKRAAREAEACFYVAQISRIAGQNKQEKELLSRCVALKQFQLTEHWIAATRLAKFESR